MAASESTPPKFDDLQLRRLRNLVEDLRYSSASEDDLQLIAQAADFIAHTRGGTPAKH